MITVQEYIQEKQPEQYAQIAVRWQLPRIAQEEEFSVFQQMLDKIMRMKPRRRD